MWNVYFLVIILDKPIQQTYLYMYIISHFSIKTCEYSSEAPRWDVRKIIILIHFWGSVVCSRAIVYKRQNFLKVVIHIISI